MPYTTDISSNYVISRKIVLGEDIKLHESLSIKEIVALIEEQVKYLPYGTPYSMNRDYECVPLSVVPETLEIDDF